MRTVGIPDAAHPLQRSRVGLNRLAPRVDAGCHRRCRPARRQGGVLLADRAGRWAGRGAPPRLVNVLAARRRAGASVVLVSSGAIAAGLAPLGLVRRPRDLATQQAAASVGQGALVAAYQHAFGAHDLTVGQVLLTADDVTRRTHYSNARRTLERLLALGVVPVINENDTVATHEIRFGDNDRLAALVAHLIHADALVLLSDVDALYDGPPHRPGSRRIPEVSGAADLTTVVVKGSASSVGTGGMATKLEAAAIMTAAGVATLLTSADRAREGLAGGGRRHPVHPDRLARTLAAAPGSPTRPSHEAGVSSTPVPSAPSWIVGSRCCRQGSRGSRAVRGGPGRRLRSEGYPVARGLVNYSSDELPSMLGRRPTISPGSRAPSTSARSSTATTWSCWTRDRRGAAELRARTDAAGTGEHPATGGRTAQRGARTSRRNGRRYPRARLRTEQARTLPVTYGAVRFPRSHTSVGRRVGAGSEGCALISVTVYTGGQGRPGTTSSCLKGVITRPRATSGTVRRTDLRSICTSTNALAQLRPCRAGRLLQYADRVVFVAEHQRAEAAEPLAVGTGVVQRGQKGWRVVRAAALAGRALRVPPDDIVRQGSASCAGPPARYRRVRAGDAWYGRGGVTPTSLVAPAVRDPGDPRRLRPSRRPQPRRRAPRDSSAACFPSEVEALAYRWSLEAMASGSRLLDIPGVHQVRGTPSSPAAASTSRRWPTPSRRWPRTPPTTPSGAG